ncbi:unnamed protein product [Coffea canephora]|uniref:Uncharacterized protein n=1 Tax=Coffea canephora TaxID=49390 RepID=A0A068V3E9_COFCA|nr:unnamed protein product [Coffea canephora]
MLSRVFMHRKEDRFCCLRAAAYFSCCGKRYLLFFFIGIEALSLIVHSSLFFSFEQTLICYFSLHFIYVYTLCNLVTFIAVLF